MEKHKKLQELIEPVVAYAAESYPQGFAKDQAMTRLQEFFWWLEKAEVDAELAKKSPPPVKSV